MLEVVKARQFPPVMPAPETQEDWLKLQKAFDAPGEEQGRQGVERTGTTYEVREIAGVRTYLVTPKKLNKRFADRVFVHTHGGAWVSRDKCGRPQSPELRKWRHCAWHPAAPVLLPAHQIAFGV